MSRLRRPSTTNKRSILIVACIVSIAWLALVWQVMLSVQLDVVNAYDNGYDVGYKVAQANVVVEDEESSIDVPLFLQTDPQWKDIPYSVETIETYGCGLTDLAMALSYCMNECITPADLASYQEAFLEADVNNPDAMSEWAVENYGVQWSGEQWGFNDNMDKLLSEGYVVLASMQGKLGDHVYGGHIVLFYGKDEDGSYLIRDPANGQNSVHPFTIEELSEVTWGALNGLKV